MLRAATNNFSEENKLGEGGFGEVFKVHFHLYTHKMWSSIVGICLFQLIDYESEKKTSILKYGSTGSPMGMGLGKLLNLSRVLDF